MLEDAEIEADEGALKVIAQAASGGMRDALSMLDQVVSFSGDRLTAEDALLVTGSIGEDIFLSTCGSASLKRCRSGIDTARSTYCRGEGCFTIGGGLDNIFQGSPSIKNSTRFDELLELISGDERFVAMANAFESGNSVFIH